MRSSVVSMTIQPGAHGAATAREAPLRASTGEGSRSGRRFASRIPGVSIAVVVAVVATVVGARVPIIGAPVTGIVLGVAIAAGLGRKAALGPGIAFASTTVLQTSVVVLGSQLSVRQIVTVGVSSLPVMLGTLATCLVAAYWIGRWLGVAGDLRTLIGVGTGICGASAIAAVTPVIGAAGVDVAYAMSTIFLFNVSAVLVFPVVGHLLGMSQRVFGLFAGTAVNDMSSVVATATTYGHQAAGYAVVVKLTRTLLIIPISLGLAALAARRARAREPTPAAPPAGGTQVTGTGTSTVRIGRLVPRFLIGFVIVATANTGGLIPPPVHAGLGELAVFLITVALSAIGLSTDLSALRRAGPRPLVLGASLWVVVSLTSLGLQHLTRAL